MLTKAIKKYQKLINNVTQRERLPATSINEVITFIKSHPANNSGVELANKQLEMRLSIINRQLKHKQITSAVNTFITSINRYLDQLLGN